MKLVALPSLTPDQAAFRLDTGELVLAEVVVETVGESGGSTLWLNGWQINEDGTRYADARGGAVMLPRKTRAVPAGADLANEEADAMVAVVDRMVQHIEARKAIASAADADTNEHTL